jgi:type I restriction enzyme S subunit
MKPSAIESLGDVPSHWEAKPRKYSITKIEQGWSPQCESEPAGDHEWGVQIVGCGNREKFDETEQKALPQNVTPVPQYEIKAGDILMSRGNTQALVGMATFVEHVRHHLLLCDLLYRFRAKPAKAESEFLVMCLRSPNVRFQIERDAVGTSASMKKIGQGTIRQFIIALPPLNEQRAIIAFVKAEIATLDGLIAEAERAVDLLQERRSALISAAVTGQIDVRGLAEVLVA